MAASKHPKTAGLDKIKALLNAKDTDAYTASKKKLVGVFGIMQGNYASRIFWVVSDRKDRRHGVINKPGQLGSYQMSLFDEMFRRW